MPTWYLGDPTFVYYPPLSTILLGFMTAILGDVFGAYRIFIILFLIALGLSVYSVGVRWSKNRLVAQFGALLAMLAPFTLRTVFVEGNLSRAVALLALPWLFWWTEQLLRERTTRRLIWLLAGLWAITIVAHGMQAAMFAIAIGVYVLLRVVNNVYVPLRRGLLAMLPVLLGAGIAAAYLLPAYSNAELTGVPFLPPEKVSLFSISLDALLPYHTNIEAASIGIATLIIAVLIMFRAGKDFHVALVGTGLVCMILAFGPAGGIFSLLPLNEQFLPERFLNIVAIVFPLVIATIPAGVWARPVSVFALTVVLLIDGSPSWRAVYLRPVPPDEQAAALALADLPGSGRVAPLTAPDPTSSQIYLTSITGGKANVSGWALENTPQQNSIRRLLDAAQKSPDYVTRVLSLWNADYVLSKFDDPKVSVELRRDLQFQLAGTFGQMELWRRPVASAFAQVLTDNRMLVIGKNATDWVYTFPFASEGDTANPAAYDAAYLSHFSVIGMSRSANVSAIEPALSNWVHAGNTLIIDLSGSDQIYEQGSALFGVHSAPKSLIGDYSLNWPPSLSSLPSHLTFSSSDGPWIGATYFGLDHVLATLVDQGQSYPVLGYQDVGKGKVWYIGFNLLYLLNQTGQQTIARTLADFILNGNAVNRDLMLPPLQTTIVNARSADLTLDYTSDKAISLVLSMTYFPRWQATIDGKPTALHDHEHLMLLDIPEGHHTLKLNYEPLSTGVSQFGLFLSIFSIGFTVVIGRFFTQRPILALGDRVNAFDDRLPQVNINDAEAEAKFAPCPNCGFRLARTGVPTNESYPFNSLDCPVCGFSLGSRNYIQGDKLTDFAKRRLAINWLREGNIARSQLQSRFGIGFDGLFETPFASHLAAESATGTSESTTNSTRDFDQTATTSIAFSPGGTLLASGGGDNTVRLWTVETGQEIVQWSYHMDRVHAVTFNSSGDLLASGSRDSTVRLWNISEKRQSTLLRGHLDAVVSLAFAGDGSKLASGSVDRTVRIWSIADGKQQFVLRGHIGIVNCVAFSKDGKLLASGSVDETVRLWNTQTGDLLFTLHDHESPLLAVGFYAESGLLVSISANGMVKFWDPKKGREVLSTQTFDYPLRNAVFSQDGTLIGTIGTAFRLLDTQTADELLTIVADEGIGGSIALSPDKKMLASAISDSRVQVWQLT